MRVIADSNLTLVHAQFVVIIRLNILSIRPVHLSQIITNTYMGVRYGQCQSNDDTSQSK